MKYMYTCYVLINIYFLCTYKYIQYYVLYIGGISGFGSFSIPAEELAATGDISGHNSDPPSGSDPSCAIYGTLGNIYIYV